MKQFHILTSAAILLALLAGASIAPSASAATTKTKVTKTRTTLLGRVMHPRSTMSSMGSAVAGAGRIVGDKRTKVYHMPGDRSMLPAAQNRVYFRTESQAIAAGFRRAGTAAGGRRTAVKSNRWTRTTRQSRTAAAPGAGHRVRTTLTTHTKRTGTGRTARTTVTTHTTKTTGTGHHLVKKTTTHM